LVSELFSAAIRVLNWMMKQSISVLAVIMLRYVVCKAVISIVDFMKWRVGKGVKLVIPVSETYPFTEKAIIV
jgi:hypothetical protein